METWTCKDTINVLIGLLGAILTAFIYEQLVSIRTQRKYKKEFAHLESIRKEFDWQHHDLVDGAIGEPKESYMNLVYSDDKKFTFRWIEGRQELKIGEKETGNGILYWENISHGRLFYHELKKNNFDHRNVFYSVVEYNEDQYDALFINADDEGTKYVMLRRKAFRPSTM